MTRLHAGGKGIIFRVGSNFAQCRTTIGRNRLPPGHVATVSNGDDFGLAVIDLHSYAIRRDAEKPIRAIVFRVIDEPERNHLHQKLHNEFGADKFIETAATYSVALGRWHIIDNEHVAHAWNNHSDARAEAARGHVAITQADFQLIPDVVHPRNIIEFSMKGESPRIVYARSYDADQVVVVEEVRPKQGMIFKTLYRQKK